MSLIHSLFKLDRVGFVIYIQESDPFLLASLGQ